MKKESLKYLKNKISKKPFKVDRVLVTAFLMSNELEVTTQNFLSSFVIHPSSKHEFTKVTEFLDILGKEVKTFNFEELIELFEFVISPSDRIVTGAVYTPENIREFIVTEAIAANRNGLSRIRIADISCGCGGFLYTAAVRLRRLTGKSFKEIFSKHLFGLDIQNYSTTRSKILLALLAVSYGETVKPNHFKIYTGDALKFIWSDVLNECFHFDAIIGNPPYVCSRNVPASTKKLLTNWEVCGTGHPDLYIPFFQIGLNNLREAGFLGYITMNTFFKSVNGRALRKYFQEKSYRIKIIDFGNAQIFQSRNTYTCVCTIEKIASRKLVYGRCDVPSEVRSFDDFKDINYTALDANKGWNLQHNVIISAIESTGVPFGDLYKTRNGIATLKNHIYIFQPIDEDDKYLYLQNGSVFPIEKEICKEIVNSNKLVSEQNLSQIKEKVIFPYEYIAELPVILDESILKKKYPKAHKYLSAKRSLLAQRDKGKGTYDSWFAFGRNQSLDKMKHKLFFPHISDRIPHYIINSDEDLMFYNGIAVIGSSRRQLMFLKKLMQTRLFWYYIRTSSKPYSASFFSLARNYIKNFGVCQLDQDELDYVITEDNQSHLNLFFERKYGVMLNETEWNKNPTLVL